MTKIAAASCTVALGATLAMVAVRAAQETPPMPKPQKEHEWLQQLVGSWDSEGEMYMDPSQPPTKTKGAEDGRMIGGFWAVLENKGDFMGSPFTGILTLGYDPEKKKYVGTWVDSMNNYLWQYQGSLDASGKVLTLETEGPCHDQPGQMSKFKETIEIKSKDHKVFTAVREKDGKWVKGMTINYRRKG